MQNAKQHRLSAEEASKHAEFVRSLTPIERTEIVTEATLWVDQNHPVGLDLFDKAWTLIRVERAHKSPETCVLTRMIVDQFLAQLLDLKDAASAPRR